MDEATTVRSQTAPQKAQGHRPSVVVHDESESEEEPMPKQHRKGPTDDKNPEFVKAITARACAQS